MSDDLGTQERMARLRECFPSDEALADWLGFNRMTILKAAKGEDDVHQDVHERVEKAHTQIQKEHAAGLDAVSYALQTIQRLREGTLTDEHLDNVEKVLQKKADDLQTAYA